MTLSGNQGVNRLGGSEFARSCRSPTRSRSATLLIAILRGSQLSGSGGWFGPTESRYKFDRLAARCGVARPPPCRPACADSGARSSGTPRGHRGARGPRPGGCRRQRPPTPGGLRPSTPQRSAIRRLPGSGHPTLLGPAWVPVRVVAGEIVGGRLGPRAGRPGDPDDCLQGEPHCVWPRLGSHVCFAEFGIIHDAPIPSHRTPIPEHSPSPHVTIRRRRRGCSSRRSRRPCGP